MILDIFSELQAARPAEETDARSLFEQAIEQARLADELGFGCWWAVEHHTDPEFSFSSAPELVLTRKLPSASRSMPSTFSIRMPAPNAWACSVIRAARSGPRMLGNPG